MGRRARSVGFSLDESDLERLDRLVETFGDEGRSAFLRRAIRHMEAVARAERLQRLQRYGAQRAGARGVGPSDAAALVKRVLSDRAEK